MLKYILRLPAEEKRDEWLPANDYGTLIHKIMERMASENIGKDEAHGGSVHRILHAQSAAL